MITNTIPSFKSTTFNNNIKADYLQNSINILAASKNFSAEDFINDCELIRKGDINSVKTITQKDVDVIKNLSTNRGYFKQELTRGYQKLLVSAYLKSVMKPSPFEINLTAFQKTGYLDVQQFKNWLKTNNLAYLEPFIINRYINNICIYEIETEFKILNDGDYKSCSLTISKIELMNSCIDENLEKIINDLIDFDNQAKDVSLADNVTKLNKLYEKCQYIQSYNDKFINTLRKIIVKPCYSNYNYENLKQFYEIIQVIIEQNPSLGCLLIEQLGSLIYTKLADTRDPDNQEKVKNTNTNWHYILKFINLYLSNLKDETKINKEMVQLILKLNAITCDKFIAALKYKKSLEHIRNEFPNTTINSSIDLKDFDDKTYQKIKKLEEIADLNLLNEENIKILVQNFKSFNNKTSYNLTDNKRLLESTIKQATFFGDLSILGIKTFTNLPPNHLKNLGLEHLASKMVTTVLNNSSLKSSNGYKNKFAADVAIEKKSVTDKEIIEKYILHLTYLSFNPIKNYELAVLSVTNTIKELLNYNISIENIEKISLALKHTEINIKNNISHLFCSPTPGNMAICNEITKDLKNTFLTQRKLLLNELILNIQDNLEELTYDDFNKYWLIINNLITTKNSFGESTPLSLYKKEIKSFFKTIKIYLELQSKKIKSLTELDDFISFIHYSERFSINFTYKMKEIVLKTIKIYLELQSKKIKSLTELNDFISFIHYSDRFSIDFMYKMNEIVFKSILEFIENQPIDNIKCLLELIKLHKLLLPEQKIDLFSSLLFKLNATNIKLIKNEEEILNIISAYTYDNDEHKNDFINSKQNKIYNALCLKIIFNYIHNDGNCIKNEHVIDFINNTLNPQYALSYICNQIFNSSYELRSLESLKRLLKDIDSLILKFNFNTDEDEISKRKTDLFINGFKNASIIKEILDLESIENYFKSHTTISNNNIQQLDEKGQALLTILINLLENKITFTEFQQILKHLENNDCTVDDVNKIFDEVQLKDIYSKVYDPAGLDTKISNKIQKVNQLNHGDFKDYEVIINSKELKIKYIRSTIIDINHLKKISQFKSLFPIKSKGMAILKTINDKLIEKKWIEVKLYVESI